MLRIRTLCLIGLAAVLPAGCVIEDADNSAFYFTWHIQYLDGSRATCDDAGTPTVVLEAQHRTSRNTYKFTFPCRDEHGLTEVLPLGPYDVSITLRDRADRPVAGIVSDRAFDIHRHGLTDLSEIGFQIQTWELTWSVAKLSPGGKAPVTCAQVDGKSVELITQIGAEDAEKYTFPCDAREGVTQAIRLGSYGVQVRLLNSAGKPLSDTGVMNFVVREDRPAAISVSFEIQ